MQNATRPGNSGCTWFANIVLFARSMIVFFRYWVPLIVWMFLIFSASADAQSTEHSSRFLEPFLRWFAPNISDEAVETVRLLMRKAAHVVEFAFLAWLAWRALQMPRRNDRRPWSWLAAGGALAIVILYAATDEIHQSFVPNRTASVKDVCIDTAGGLAGMFCVWMWHRFKRVPFQARS
jgi:VanZ family protein